MTCLDAWCLRLLWKPPQVHNRQLLLSLPVLWESYFFSVALRSTGGPISKFFHLMWCLVKIQPALKVGISFSSLSVCFYIFNFCSALQSTSAHKWKLFFENGSCYLNSRFLSAVPLRWSVVQDLTRSLRNHLGRKMICITAPSFLYIPRGHFRILDTIMGDACFVPGPIAQAELCNVSIWLYFCDTIREKIRQWSLVISFGFSQLPFDCA